MTLFWIAVAVLTMAATASIVLPLLTGGGDRTGAQASSDDARRLAVYRDRRREIEAERDAGRLGDDEARRALDELVEEAAQQLPQQAPAAPPDAGSGRARSIAIAVIAATAIPLAALAIYAMLGSPAVVGLDSAQMRAQTSPQALQQAIEELRERVRREPQDVEAWAMLAHAHRLSGDHAAAAQAFERAVALAPDNARLLADYAESAMLAQGGDFAGKPVELLERALAADPAEGKAVALMGAAQYRLGNREQALRYMRMLAQGMDPASDEGRHLAELIARIEAEVAGAPAAAAQAGRDAAQAPAQPVAPGQAVIAGTIVIDESLRAQAGAGATLFVVARDAGGSRVPLAVQRLSVGDWPVAFALGDAQAMDPARPISRATAVSVEARVSRSGTAARQSGDLFGVSAQLAPGTRDAVVRIDQKVP